MKKVGFIGLGIMGKPMALNLRKAGVALMVSDLNPAAVAEVTAAGAEQGTYREIGAACDVVITILPSADWLGMTPCRGAYAAKIQFTQSMPLRP